MGAPGISSRNPPGGSGFGFRACNTLARLNQPVNRVSLGALRAKPASPAVPLDPETPEIVVQRAAREQAREESSLAHEMSVVGRVCSQAVLENARSLFADRRRVPASLLEVCISEFAPVCCTKAVHWLTLEMGKTWPQLAHAYANFSGEWLVVLPTKGGFRGVVVVTLRTFETEYRAANVLVVLLADDVKKPERAAGKRKRSSKEKQERAEARAAKNAQQDELRQAWSAEVLHALESVRDFAVSMGKGFVAEEECMASAEPVALRSGFEASGSLVLRVLALVSGTDLSEAGLDALRQKCLGEISRRKRLCTTATHEEGLLHSTTPSYAWFSKFSKQQSTYFAYVGADVARGSRVLRQTRELNVGSKSILQACHERGYAAPVRSDWHGSKLQNVFGAKALEDGREVLIAGVASTSNLRSTVSKNVLLAKQVLVLNHVEFDSSDPLEAERALHQLVNSSGFYKRGFCTGIMSSSSAPSSRAVVGGSRDNTSGTKGHNLTRLIQVVSQLRSASKESHAMMLSFVTQDVYSLKPDSESFDFYGSTVAPFAFDYEQQAAFFSRRTDLGVRLGKKEVNEYLSDYRISAREEGGRWSFLCSGDRIAIVHRSVPLVENHGGFAYRQTQLSALECAGFVAHAGWAFGTWEAEVIKDLSGKTSLVVRPEEWLYTTFDSILENHKKHTEVFGNSSSVVSHRQLHSLATVERLLARDPTVAFTRFRDSQGGPKVALVRHDVVKCRKRELGDETAAAFDVEFPVDFDVGSQRRELRITFVVYAGKPARQTVLVASEEELPESLHLTYRRAGFGTSDNLFDESNRISDNFSVCPLQNIEDWTKDLARSRSGRGVVQMLLTKHHNNREVAKTLLGADNASHVFSLEVENPPEQQCVHVFRLGKGGQARECFEVACFQPL